MNYKHFLPILLIVFSFLCAEHNADKILTQISNHLKGLDRSMVIKSNIIKKGEIKKSQKVKVQICWPKNSEKVKLTLIEFFEPKRKIGVKFWEHTLSSNLNTLKWMTMPITGKLKDISNKNPKKSEFDFSDLQLTKEIILSHQNTIIENSNEIIIKAISKDNKQKKLLYIDKEHNFIHKVETFNKKNKIMKSVQCTDFQIVDNYKIASKIIIEDFKKKYTVDVQITDFSFTEFSDLTIFEPKGK
tara:strand:- start:1517 stop:2248 length:732 start_codon:yes stop_codon:yes gene_type:complete